jgi:hypothetical protein
VSVDGYEYAERYLGLTGPRYSYQPL